MCAAPLAIVQCASHGRRRSARASGWCRVSSLRLRLLILGAEHPPIVRRRHVFLRARRRPDVAAVDAVIARKRKARPAEPPPHDDERGDDGERQHDEAADGSADNGSDVGMCWCVLSARNDKIPQCMEDEGPHAELEDDAELVGVDADDVLDSLGARAGSMYSATVAEAKLRELFPPAAPGKWVRTA
jgi:hypothetical protein